jgi:hypothetical protein
MWERHGEHIVFVVGGLVVETLAVKYTDRDEANAVVEQMNEKEVQPSGRAA